MSKVTLHRVLLAIYAVLLYLQTEASLSHAIHVAIIVIIVFLASLLEIKSETNNSPKVEI